MKKTYKIEVDCANCANKMEEATKRTAGVKDATVNFMTLKMVVEFEEGVDVKTVQEVLGHEHLNTTEIYTHIENTELKIAAEANPLSRLLIDDETV